MYDARTLCPFAATRVITFPTNHKLHQRATTLLQRSAGVDWQTATTLLQGAGGETKTTLAMSLLHITAEVAHQRLSAQNGRLRETLAALDALLALVKKSSGLLLPPRATQSFPVHNRSERIHGPVAPH